MREPLQPWRARSPLAAVAPRRGLALASAFLAGILVSAGVAWAAQPNMENALRDLQSARASLQAASANKGGHRDRAIRLVDSAIQEVRAGIGFAATH